MDGFRGQHLLFGLLLLVASSFADLRGEGDTSLGRLPRNLSPYHYRVHLEPDVYDGDPPFYFFGHVNIDFECIEETSVIYINAERLTIRNESVVIVSKFDSSIPAPDPVWTSWEIDEELQFFKLHLVDNLRVGSTYQLRLSFDGELWPYWERGLYYEYVDSSDDRYYLVATQFESYFARRAFPCFDEPDFKATFDFIMAYKFPWHALSNMPPTRTEYRDDWAIDHFQTTPKMSTYLLASVVAPYSQRTSQTSRGTEVKIWSRMSIRDEMDYALDMAVNILEWFEDYTGIAYHLPKIDHVALPMKGGAMENWGMITYGEHYLRYNYNRTSLHLQRSIACVIAHEVAHQWFGNLVTTKWWNDIWLNEGFAALFENLPQQSIQGWDWRELHYLRRGFRMLDLDRVSTTSTVRKVIPSPWDAPSAFSTAAYYKGSCVVRMCQEILGEESFKQAIRKYLTKYEYSNAVTDNLWAELTMQADLDNIQDNGNKIFMKEKMDPWVDQKGYPIITMTRPGNAPSLTQKLFMDPEGQSWGIGPYLYEWFVPVSMYDNDDVVAKYQPEAWMNRANITVTSGLPDSNYDWMMINVRVGSFQITHYTTTPYNLIRDALQSEMESFPAMNRAKFLYDAFELARAHIISESTAMDMTLYLNQENTMLPFYLVEDYFLLQHLVFIGHPEIFFDFMAYWGNKISPVYDQVGFDAAADETNFDEQLRSYVVDIACECGYQPCLDDAAAKFNLIVSENNIEVVPPDLRVFVYCFAISEGVANSWDDTLDLYMVESYEDDRERQLTGLACERNVQQLRDYIALTFNTSVIRAEEAQYALEAIASHNRGRHVIFNYMDDNWRNDPFPSYVNKYDVFEVCVSGFSRSEDILNVEYFIIKYPAEDDHERDVYERSLRAALTNNLWEQNNREEMHDWFVANTPAAERNAKGASAASGAYGSIKHLHRRLESRHNDMLH